MAAASWSMVEAMPRWRISGLTNTAATHGEYCGRCTQSFWMTERYPQESRRRVQLLYMEPCPFAYGYATRLTQRQRSHGADSTTDRRSSSQLFPGAAGTPRVVALGMSSPVALICRTRIRRQNCHLFLRPSAGLSEKAAGRQRDSGACRFIDRQRTLRYRGRAVRAPRLLRSGRLSASASIGARCIDVRPIHGEVFPHRQNYWRKQRCQLARR